MNINDRVRVVRKSAGIGQAEFGAALAVGQGHLSNIEHGAREVTDKIRKLICHEFGISEAWLLDGTGEMYSTTADNILDDVAQRFGLSDTERGLLDAYFELAEDERAVFAATLHKIATAATQEQAQELMAPVKQPRVALVPDEPRTHWARIWLSEQSASAGTGTYLGPEEMELVQVDATLLTEAVDFAVPVSGDSMEPKYADGDILLVRKMDVEVGEIGVFTLDGHAYVKECGQGVLISLNAAYAPIPVDESVRCNGKVVDVIHESDIIRD